jgi:Cu(I)/Ag(I) efflux system protein CusF
MKFRKLACALLVLPALCAVSASAQELVEGQVTKTDASAGKITIKHGAFKKFDMDEPMTMVYRVQDPAMLKTVKPGDEIRFDAEKVNGNHQHCSLLVADDHQRPCSTKVSTAAQAFLAFL